MRSQPGCGSPLPHGKADQEGRNPTRRRPKADRGAPERAAQIRRRLRFAHSRPAAASFFGGAGFERPGLRRGAGDAGARARSGARPGSSSTSTPSSRDAGAGDAWVGGGADEEGAEAPSVCTDCAGAGEPFDAGERSSVRCDREPTGSSRGAIGSSGSTDGRGAARGACASEVERVLGEGVAARAGFGTEAVAGTSSARRARKRWKMQRSLSSRHRSTQRWSLPCVLRLVPSAMVQLSRHESRSSSQVAFAQSRGAACASSGKANSSARSRRRSIARSLRLAGARATDVGRRPASVTL